MPLAIGSHIINNGDPLRIGGVQPDKIMRGSNLVWQNTQAPSAITDFSASDDETGQVTMTFSNATGIPNPTYNLYENTILIASNISSGYVRFIESGTRSYYVLAVNSAGSTPSNTDNGTSLSSFNGIWSGSSLNIYDDGIITSGGNHRQEWSSNLGDWVNVNGDGFSGNSYAVTFGSDVGWTTVSPRSFIFNYIHFSFTGANMNYEIGIGFEGTSFAGNPPTYGYTSSGGSFRYQADIDVGAWVTLT